jgi:hypothetical protein
LFEVERVRVGLFDVTETLEDPVTGRADGASVLLILGEDVGDAVGNTVGLLVGDTVRDFEGIILGDVVGDDVVDNVGDTVVGNAVRESIVGLLVPIVEGDTDGTPVEPDKVGIIVVLIVGPEEGIFSSGSCVISTDKDVVGDKVSTVEDDRTGVGSSKGCGINKFGKRNALGNCCAVGDGVCTITKLGVLVEDGPKIIGGLVGLLVDIDGSVGLLVGFLDGIIDTLGLDDTLGRKVGDDVGKKTGAAVVSGPATLLRVGIIVGVKVSIGSDVSSITIVVGLEVGCNESTELGSGLGISVV